MEPENGLTRDVMDTRSGLHPPADFERHPDFHLGRESFHYTPLNHHEREIRILELDLGLGTMTNAPTLLGRLKHVSLLNPGQYTALSYLWGDLGSSTFLAITLSNGSVAAFRITENLSTALWAVWEKHRRHDADSPLRIWVDAICINQDDLQERIQQVESMRKIYSQASNVDAYVGPFDGTMLSTDSIENLTKTISTMNLPVDTSNRRTSSYDFRALPDNEITALRTFFDEEYWKRVWVIQELTVNPEVTILYGGLKFEWNAVARSLSLLENAFTEGEHPIFSSESLAASHLLKFRDHYVNNTPIGLFQAMSWTLHTKSTDPRDRIFALLALCHDGEKLVKVPNYMQSFESIISDLTIAMMRLHRSLDFLLLRGSTSRKSTDPPLPSWASNWPGLWCGTSTIQEKNLLRTPTKLDFNPFFGTSAGGVLRVEAIYVGEIVNLSSRVRAASQTSNHRQKRKLLVASKDFEKVFPEDDWHLQAKVWNTLTMSNMDKYPENGVECFWELWNSRGRGSIYDSRIIDWIDEHADFRVHDYTLLRLSQIRPQLPKNEKKNVLGTAVEVIFGYSRTDIVDWNSHTARHASAPSKRKNMWGDANHALEQALGSGMRLAELHLPTINSDCTGYPGLVHPSGIISDQIFLIKGCSLPVVLRPVEAGLGRFSVVGGVFLDEEYFDLIQGDLKTVELV